ncbi:MAG: two-component system response regulator [Deltaproteobacteria bacterium]|nr:MAG: two-component system response regulator [Deltaproteobacteria bacterium]
MLIDDSEVSLMVAETLLLTDGYDVRTAMSVAEFDEAVRDFHPDIILTDVEMPEIGGPELCKRVKATPQTATVPVVLYSTKEPDELAALAAECGAEGYVCKANRHDDLPKKLAEIWARLSGS